MVSSARRGRCSPGTRGARPGRCLRKVDGAHLHVHHDVVIFVNGTRKRGRPCLQVRGVGVVGKGRRVGATPFRTLLLFFFLLVVIFLLFIVIVISLGNLLIAAIIAVVIVVLGARGIPSSSVAVALDGLDFFIRRKREAPRLPTKAALSPQPLRAD